MQVTEAWVDTAMQLGDKSLRTMERLVRAQDKRPAHVVEAPAAMHHEHVLQSAAV
jgi:DSF synthase